MSDKSIFRFLGAAYSPESGSAELAYALDESEPLIETITFPDSPWPSDPARQAALQKALNLLHFIAGVSYYKATVPRKLASGGDAMTAGLAGFLNDLYTKGLAEFAYVNDIDIAARVDFSQLVSRHATAQAVRLNLPDRALIAMGGGKDSLVALSLLQEKGVAVQPVCVGNSTLIGDTARAAGLPLLRIGRELAPELAHMNQEGAYNGHVPVTAINSAILICAAILYGYRYVVFANERSADEATLTDATRGEVNHQYSKTSEFEAAFRRVIARHVSPDIEYFSILRPYAELDIVRRFTALKKYHHVFSSCNRNFHIDGPRTVGRWCGDCPKCRFTALALAVFMPPAGVSGILGRDLLDDAAQCDGYRELCRLGREKPFECVGEAGECRAALAALASSDAWKDHLIVRTLAPELKGVDVPDLAGLLQASDHHFIPEALAGDGVADGK